MARFRVNFYYLVFMKKYNEIFLGFDFGTKNIGVAVGQAVTKTATPLKILAAKNGVPNWHEIMALIATWQPGAVVVGVPVNLDGTPHHVTELARKFIASLKEHAQLPIYEAEERLTTKAAREEIFTAGGYKALQDKAIDSIAAVLILEEWMRKGSE